MVVQRALAQHVARARLELLAGPGQRVAVQVVQRDDLRQVREVVLGGRVALVLEEVLERRDRPAVVERRAWVGQDQDQRAPRPQDAAPLAQRGDRVGDVLERVRRQQHVVGPGHHAPQVGGLPDERLAGRLAGVEAERRALLDVVLPQRPVAEVRVVEAADQRVEGEDPAAAEDLARPADLEGAGVPGERRDDLQERGAPRPHAPADEVDPVRRPARHLDRTCRDRSDRRSIPGRPAAWRSRARREAGTAR